MIFIQESTPCEACIKVYQREGGEPPCDKCVPPLFLENEEVFSVFCECSDLYTYGPSGPAAVDVVGVDTVIRRKGVTDADYVFQRVVGLMKWVLQYQRNRSQQKP